MQVEIEGNITYSAKKEKKNIPYINGPRMIEHLMLKSFMKTAFLYHLKTQLGELLAQCGPTCNPWATFDK